MSPKFRLLLLSPVARLWKTLCRTCGTPHANPPGCSCCLLFPRRCFASWAARSSTSLTFCTKPKRRRRSGPRSATPSAASPPRRASWCLGPSPTSPAGGEFVLPSHANCRRAWPAGCARARLVGWRGVRRYGRSSPQILFFLPSITSPFNRQGCW